MHLNTTHGDDMALYLLCRMYNKHAYVHTARYGWSTLPFKTETPFMEVAAKCDIELVLLHCWSFGEVLKIRKPMLPNKPNEKKAITTTNDNTQVISQNTVPQTVIPVNAADMDENNKLMQCTVRIECLSKGTLNKQTSRPTEPRASVSKSEYSMRSRQPQKKVTHCTSGRKRPVVDYGQYDTSTDPPSPPKRHRKVDLKRKPSKTCIAAGKYKTKSLGGPRPVRKKDTHSLPVSTPNPTDEAKPSTSGIITVAATAEDTQTAIDALLSLGTDLPDLDGNASLVPLVPQRCDADQPNEPSNPSQPSIIGTAVKIEDRGTPQKPPQSDVKKKKTFVTVKYKLKRKYVNTTRKFPCEKCHTNFNSQHEVNEHFRTTHLPVQCDMCEKTFDTPAAMVKHRYHHYEYMYECDHCGKGFHLESQLREHLQVHQVQGDWTCFRPKCGKRFKCESELNVQLIAHNKNVRSAPIPTPTLATLELTNVDTATRNPSCVQKGGKGFKWVQQRKRHLDGKNC